MKKLNPFTKLVFFGVAGAVVALLAFAVPNINAEKEAAADATNSAAYSLDYCVVSGEKLGEMGDPVVKTYDGREVKFCCNMCVKKWESDPAKYSKKLDDAIIAAQKPGYPLETCVVTGEPLVPSQMGDPVDYVYQNRLVRFCCNGCVKAFNKEPAKYLQKIDVAAASEDAPQPESTPESHEGHQH